jgi:hypothetical protein
LELESSDGKNGRTDGSAFLLLISVVEIAGDVEEEGTRKMRVVLVPLAPAGGNNE